MPKIKEFSMEKRYEVALDLLKNYDGKLHSRLVLQLKKSDPVMYKKQYYALMLHKYRTLLVYGFLLKGIWEDEVTKSWDYSNLIINL